MTLPATRPLAAALLAAVVSAQPATPTATTDPREIAAQLRSDVPAVVAWGGYNAGALGAGSLAKEVQGALARVMALPESSERHLCVNAVLDALILLGARCEPEWLDRWWTLWFRNEALILAARTGAAGAPFLRARLRGSISDLGWQAASNLLLNADPRGLATVTVADLRLKVRVVVVTEEDWRLPSMWGGSGVVSVPADFPPIAQYFLLPAGVRPDSQPFADGPTPIHYRRVEHVARHGFFISCARCSGHGWDEPFDRDEYRLRLLARLLGRPFDQHGLEGTKTVTVVWQDAAAYRATIEDELMTLPHHWRSLRGALVAAGLVHEAAIPATPPVVVQLDDQRTDRRVPLPAIDALRR